MVKAKNGVSDLVSKGRNRRLKGGDDEQSDTGK